MVSKGLMYIYVKLELIIHVYRFNTKDRNLMMSLNFFLWQIRISYEIANEIDSEIRNEIRSEIYNEIRMKSPTKNHLRQAVTLNFFCN